MDVKSAVSIGLVFVGGLGGGYVLRGDMSASGAPAVAAKGSGDGGSSGLTEAQVNKLVEAYILKNPTVIMASVDDYQRNGFLRQIEGQVAPFVEVLEDTTNVAMMGAADPAVKIIEFFDYQCPHCKANHEVLNQLLADDPTIALLPKHLPILGDGSADDMSLYAAMAAEAARLQGKFEPMHRALMDRQVPLSRETINASAQAIGLDMDRFYKDAASDAVRQTVERSRDLATEIGIAQAGTPGYIVGGKVMIGAAPDSYDRLRKMVEEARN